MVKTPVTVAVASTLISAACAPEGRTDGAASAMASNVVVAFIGVPQGCESRRSRQGWLQFRCEKSFDARVRHVAGHEGLADTVCEYQRQLAIAHFLVLSHQ